MHKVKETLGMMVMTMVAWRVKIDLGCSGDQQAQGSLLTDINGSHIAVLTGFVLPQGGGTPGMTMGDWLVEKGLDAPRTNKPKAASSLTVLRQRQVQQARAGHAAMQGQPQQHVGRQVSPV